MITANLSISGQVTIDDPTGAAWTIFVLRPGEPRSPWVNRTTSYWWAQLFRRISRAVRRDKRWVVEVMEGPAYTDDRRSALVQSTQLSRDEALISAADLACEIQVTGVPDRSR